MGARRAKWQREALNRSFQEAKKASEDEFYTQLPDIERELRHYKKHFKGKVVYCNCDDPRVSNFFHYFSYNFETLGLKKLITTCYRSQERDLFSQNDSEQAIYLEYNGDKNGNSVPDPEEIGIKPLKGDGDFRSAESIELLKQADIVVTNPPFSLFREYVAQLIEHEKKFLIIGNQNAITYKEIFPLIQNNKIWVGYNSGDMQFKSARLLRAASDSLLGGRGRARSGGASGTSCWFTNLDIAKRHEDLILYKTYTAGGLSEVRELRRDRGQGERGHPDGLRRRMGVPITFLDKYNPDQFEILGQQPRAWRRPMSTIAKKGTLPAGRTVASTCRTATAPTAACTTDIVIRNKRL